MADLDFAILAEYARVDPSGLLTVIGGTFERLQINGPGLVHQVYLAIRAKLDDSENSVSFQVKVLPPDQTQFQMGITGTANVNPRAQPMSGNKAVLSVVGMGIPINSPGRYTVQVTLEGGARRDLQFIVDFAQQSAG